MPQSAPKLPNPPRILYLDGLRCVAIFSVILFHYFSGWTQPYRFENFYPYGNLFVPYFRFGYYGVHLFFIVSGFVITLTLYKCTTAREFVIRRFARLWPSMLLCCLISLLLLRAIPIHYFLPSALGLIPSLTFVDPRYFNWLFHSTKFQWIDGAYWSLFVEVRFYLLAAIIYFTCKVRFVQNFCMVSAIVVATNLVIYFFHLRGHKLLNQLFFVEYLPWFLLGIAFYLLENHLQPRLRSALFSIAILSLLATAALDHSYSELAITVSLPLLFLAAARLAIVNRILSFKLLTAIGAASYSLYLLHQRLGVTLIGWLGKLLNFTGAYSAILAIIVAAILVLISRIIYTRWETPLNRLIVARFAPRSPQASQASDRHG